VEVSVFFSSIIVFCATNSGFIPPFVLEKIEDDSALFTSSFEELLLKNFKIIHAIAIITNHPQAGSDFFECSSVCDTLSFGLSFDVDIFSVFLFEVITESI
jgi:hypothetical protein